MTHKYGWGGEVQGGSPSSSTDLYYSYTNNRRNGSSYDAAGNLTNDVGQTFTYDATGQQATATLGAYFLQQYYDGNGLRVKKNDNGAQTYYLRSSVLGGQVVAEISWTGAIWQWSRGYVYLGSKLLAVQQGGVFWMHEDPVNKSKRVTNSAGTWISAIELDPWGADTNRSISGAFQPRKFTSYERDGNGGDEAMFRRYNLKHSRFDQPDPYDGSYSLTDPQSFNRYAYVQNDPVNFVDPSGLNLENPYDTTIVIDVNGRLLPHESLFGGSVFGRVVEGGFVPPSSGGEDDFGGTTIGPPPQDTSRDTDTRTSCQRFADIVEQIADGFPYYTPSDFESRLYSRFANSGTEFSSDGFKKPFQDFSGSSNQARHYVGGLHAGFEGRQMGSETVGRWIADAREYGIVPIPLLVIPYQTDSNKADQRLNAVSTRHGGALSDGDIKPFQLADRIRKEVCE